MSSIQLRTLEDTCIPGGARAGMVPSVGRFERPFGFREDAGNGGNVRLGGLSDGFEDGPERDDP